MPFKSENQRRFLWANHPEIARRWTNEHGSKVATDGQNDTSGVPAFMQKRGGKKPDEKAAAKTEAAKRRLQMMNKKKGAVGDFNGPGDGVHTKRTGK
jgi:hypothetical protein